MAEPGLPTESILERVQRMRAALRGVYAAMATTELVLASNGRALGEVGRNLRLAGLEPLDRVLAELGEVAHGA